MQIGHLLDFGCGANVNLAKALKVKHRVTYQAYDPGVPRFSKSPLPAEMVACIDVLEHVEPQFLEQTLDELCRLAQAIVFLTVTTVAALKFLPDGRNAHLIQEPMSWWLPKFWSRWDIQTVQAMSEKSFFVIGLAKPHLEMKDGTPLV